MSKIKIVNYYNKKVYLLFNLIVNFLLIKIIIFLEKSREIPRNFKIYIKSLKIKQDTN
jgi:hypothetical protein